MPSPSTSEKKCAPTAPGSKARAAGGFFACVETVPTVAGTPTSDTTAGAVQTTASPCPAEPGSYSFTRHDYCLNSKKQMYTLYGQDATTVRGTGEISISTNATLNATNTSWDEHIVVEATRFTGWVRGLVVAFDASCSGNCTMNKAKPWDGHALLGREGAKKEGDVTFHSGVTQGRTSIYPSYHADFYAVEEDAPGDHTVRWTSQVEVRCDAELSTAGCVAPQKKPDLVLPMSVYGTAAVTYLFAETKLPDAWGTPRNPLWRIDISDKEREERYRRTCGRTGTTPFVPIPVVPDDSCDEYPFARSFQGGKYAAQCAEIIPTLENNQWVVYDADPRRPVTYREPCVRGHVPLKQNEAAGGAYGSLVKTDRILDMDPFIVSIPA